MCAPSMWHNTAFKRNCPELAKLWDPPSQGSCSLSWPGHRNVPNAKGRNAFQERSERASSPVSTTLRVCVTSPVSYASSAVHTYRRLPNSIFTLNRDQPSSSNQYEYIRLVVQLTCHYLFNFSSPTSRDSSVRPTEYSTPSTPRPKRYRKFPTGANVSAPCSDHMAQVPASPTAHRKSTAKLWCRDLLVLVDVFLVGLWLLKVTNECAPAIGPMLVRLHVELLRLLHMVPC